MKWILILAVPWGSPLHVNGTAVTTAVFDDKAACEAAIVAVTTNRPRKMDTEYAKGVCVPSASEAQPQKEG